MDDYPTDSCATSPTAYLLRTEHVQYSGTGIISDHIDRKKQVLLH